MQEQVGIYCFKNKTFYYIEDNIGASSTDVDKLRVTLSARGLINLLDMTSIDNGYRVMSLKVAQVEGYIIAPVYISPHVRTIEKKRVDTNPIIDIWG